jgi:two-component system, NarL family, invasion response regulator UvrY
LLHFPGGFYGETSLSRAVAHGVAALTKAFPTGESESALVRILVVDDNPAVRSYLRSILEQQNTWQVCSEARTGQEAIDRVRESKPDLILLDFQMPDTNGLDVARQISHMSPGLPILMITVHFNRQLVAAAQKVGIRGACAKSDVGSIVDAVETILHRGTYFPDAHSPLDKGGLQA